MARTRKSRGRAVKPSYAADIPVLTQRQATAELRQATHEKRMDQFEGELKALGQRMDRGFENVIARIDAREQRHGSETKEDFDSLKKELRSEIERVEDLAKEESDRIDKKQNATDAVVAARGRTHWPTVMSGGGLALTIMGFIATGIMLYVNSQNSLTQKDIVHARELADKDTAHHRENLSRVEREIGALRETVKADGKRLTIFEAGEKPRGERTTDSVDPARP